MIHPKMMRCLRSPFCSLFLLLIKYFIDKSSLIICYFGGTVWSFIVIQVNYSRPRSLVLPAITRGVSRYVLFTPLQVVDVLFDKEPLRMVGMNRTIAIYGT